MTALYSPLTNKNLWSGRTDANEDEYIYQAIQFLDLNNPSLTALTLSTSRGLSAGFSNFAGIMDPADKPRDVEHGEGFEQQYLNGYALLGFECDAGVSRNQGNPGASEGPNAFRRALAKFPIHKSVHLFDAGNVSCTGDDLETAQFELSHQIKKIMTCGLTPIVIGGGHETAWGHFQGLAHLNKDIAILNFDAHFDLRPLIDGQLGSSGTPFRQIHDFLTTKNKPFHYYCTGIQPFSNTKYLFDYAHELNVNYELAETIHANPYDMRFIDNIINQHEHIYVSICLDVFQAGLAPGVSAPQVLGISAAYVIEALKRLKNSGKVISIDIVELAPKYDIRDQTAKLAATLLMNYL